MLVFIAKMKVINSISIKQGRISSLGLEPVAIPLEPSVMNSGLRTSHSKVCGDRYEPKIYPHELFI